MKILGKSNEDEMVYEFLKMELGSERFREAIETVLREMGLDDGIILDGDVTSTRENRLRTEVLGRFRGYGRDDGIFTNYPKHIDWVWAELGWANLLKIKYIDYSYWNEISGGTGSPLDAAKHILAGKPVFDMPTDGHMRNAERLAAGEAFPPMIFLTDKSKDKYVILEGHCRMTAYALAPVLFRGVRALVGICENIEFGGE
jgi:hypothetical protein